MINCARQKQKQNCIPATSGNLTRNEISREILSHKTKITNTRNLLDLYLVAFVTGKNFCREGEKSATAVQIPLIVVFGGCSPSQWARNNAKMHGPRVKCCGYRTFLFRINMNCLSAASKSTACSFVPRFVFF